MTDDVFQTKVTVKNIKSSSDSFTNFAASLGIDPSMVGRNISSDNTYGFNPITRNRTLLEWMYRGAWLVGQIVDCIGEDMTKRGVELTGDNDPQSIERLHSAIMKHQIWTQVSETIKWGRLYGGSIMHYMIDGQDAATPLRLDSIGPDQFQGLAVLDRWMVWPSLEDLVTDKNDPDYGEPKYYDVVADAPALKRQRLHHSRIHKFDGVTLPYWQKISENMWGMSVLERIFDRLTAFDSTTQGAAQLVFKAYLRTMKVNKLRELIAAGGPLYDAFLKQMALIKTYQSSEGITLIDAEDDFQTHTYSFAGLEGVILSMGQQLSGASQIPLVRLFGQSPAGLNATGESDLRTYYDGINQRQETQLRRPIHVIINLMCKSLGIQLAEGWNFTFNPLWQLTDDQKSVIAAQNTNTITGAEQTGLVKPSIALKELKQQSRVTGVWTNITDDDIKDAEEAELLPPPPDDGGEPEDGVEGEPSPEPVPSSSGEGQRGNVVNLHVHKDRARRLTSDARPIIMPASPHDWMHLDDIASDKIKKGVKWHEEQVPHHNLRATQPKVENRYDPSQASDDVPAYGVKTPEGHVHLLNGHHRGEQAVKAKKPMSVMVWKHDVKNDKTPSDPNGKASLDRILDGEVASGRSRDFQPKLPLIEFHGLPILIETFAGDRRGAGMPLLPADYGYIRRTSSAEGKDEAMDVFLGPDKSSHDAFIIDMIDTNLAEFEEHKVMLGFKDEKSAVDCFNKSYKGADVAIGGVVQMSIDELAFKEWLHQGDHSKPLAIGQKGTRSWM